MRAERGGGRSGQAVPHLRRLDRPRRGHHILLLLLRAEALLQTPEYGRVGGDEKKRVRTARRWSISSDSWAGLTLVYDVPPSCPAAQPLLPTAHQLKQNLAEGGTAKSSQHNYQSRWITLYSANQVQCCCCCRYTCN